MNVEIVKKRTMRQVNKSSLRKAQRTAFVTKNVNRNENSKKGKEK
jgi:hypothetical protein